MAGSGTRTEHSAGGIVVHPTPRGPVVLVIKDGYGNWGFPKGHIETGEGAVDAAVREIREETAIVGIHHVAHLGVIDWYFRAGDDTIHKYCHFYLFHGDGGEPCPQAEEGIRAAEWVSFDEALGRISYDNARALLEQAREVVGSAEKLDARSQVG